MQKVPGAGEHAYKVLGNARAEIVSDSSNLLLSTPTFVLAAAAPEALDHDDSEECGGQLCGGQLFVTVHSAARLPKPKHRAAPDAYIVLKCLGQEFHTFARSMDTFPLWFSPCPCSTC